MDLFKKIFMSKTVNGNIFMTIAIIVAQSYGYDLTPEKIAVIMAAVNVVLRLITKKPVSEKTGFEDLFNMK